MHLRTLFGLIILLAAPAIMRPVAARADANVVAAWIQLGPGSTDAAPGRYGDAPASLTPTILARAVVTDATACPALTVDGALTIPMSQRFIAGNLGGTLTPGAPGDRTSKPGYPATFVNATATEPHDLPDGTAAATTRWGECEAIIPPGHVSASIGGVTLKLPVANPQRILVIADTGCRMDGGNQQDCHSATGFPFAALANYEALFQPDLVVHVGDYFYRDTDCLKDGTEAVAGCDIPSSAAYEVWGDTFDSWNADLFYPARTLLAAAPWIMVRGNHESCGRGARGWFALLEPRPFNFADMNCAGGTGRAKVAGSPVYTADFQPTYVVPAGNVNFLVHDSSFADDFRVDTNMAANYDLDLTRLLHALADAGSSSKSILVSHRPVFGLVKGSTRISNGIATADGGNMTMQYAFSGAATRDSRDASAFRNGVPPDIALFLSGHIHQFEYVNFTDNTLFPPQLIVGMGGDNLDRTSNPDGTTLTYQLPQGSSFVLHDAASGSRTMPANGYAQAEFGFVVLNAAPEGFAASVYTIGSNKVGVCTITLSPRGIQCWQ